MNESRYVSRLECYVIKPDVMRIMHPNYCESEDNVGIIQLSFEEARTLAESLMYLLDKYNADQGATNATQ